MKATFVLTTLLYTLAYVNGTDAQATYCGGSCTSSAACANSAENLLCRCNYLTCSTSSDKCSGGCMFNTQCADWAGGDGSCICTWWFECDSEENAKNPGYKPFLKIAAMSKLRADERKALEEQENDIKDKMLRSN